MKNLAKFWALMLLCILIVSLAAIISKRIASGKNYSEGYYINGYWVDNFSECKRKMSKFGCDDSTCKIIRDEMS